jgi:hypothetical protein
VTNKEIALAEIADRIAQAQVAGLRATVESWRDYYRNVEARPDNEIVVSSRTSTSPGSWSSATGRF